MGKGQTKVDLGPARTGLETDCKSVFYILYHLVGELESYYLTYLLNGLMVKATPGSGVFKEQVGGVALSYIAIMRHYYTSLCIVHRYAWDPPLCCVKPTAH